MGSHRGRRGPVVDRAAIFLQRAWNQNRTHVLIRQSGSVMGRQGAMGSGRDDACGRRCYSQRVNGAIQVGGLGHQRTSSRYAPTGAGIGDAKAVRREGQGLRRQRSPQPGREPRHDGAYGERPSRGRRGSRQHRRRGLRGWIHSSGDECTGRIEYWPQT